MKAFLRGIAYNFLLIMIGVTIAHSALPSEEIRHVAAPGVIDLQNVDPAAPKAFAVQDGNLSMFSLRELPNLGHYCSWADQEVQTEAVLSDSQKAVLAVPSNSTGQNVTAINSTELIYL